jgi:NAD(P)-dependent dehydrogenase (short-subunit alcohol dehydrogenase family)
MKNVLITGGNRGIGAAIATIFAQNKYNVVINYHCDEKAAN